MARKIDLGAHALPIRSMTLSGQDMNMIVGPPQGNATFQGRLNPDGRSFSGTVTYFNGRLIPLSARRQ